MGKPFVTKDATPYTVQALQRALTRRGFAAKPDGKLGPETTKAIRGFQGAEALRVDGKAGPVTYGRLRDLGAFDGGPRVGREALFDVTTQRNVLAAYGAALQSTPLLTAVSKADAMLGQLAPLPSVTSTATGPAAVAFAPLLAVPFIASEAFAASAVSAAGWAAAVTTAGAVAVLLGNAAKEAAKTAPTKGTHEGTAQTGKGPLRGDFDGNMKKRLLKAVKILAGLALWLVVGLGKVAVTTAAKGAAQGAIILGAALVALIFGSRRRK